MADPTETTPCSLSPTELEQRLREWHSLDGALLDVEPAPAGVVLNYRLDADVAASLVELIAGEARCCPGVRFDATVRVVIDDLRGLLPLR